VIELIIRGGCCASCGERDQDRLVCYLDITDLLPHEVIPRANVLCRDEAYCSSRRRVGKNGYGDLSGRQYSAVTMKEQGP
jgi:hypothetical protein